LLRVPTPSSVEPVSIDQTTKQHPHLQIHPGLGGGSWYIVERVKNAWLIGDCRQPELAQRGAVEVALS
jgi:hypothetical protein